MIRNCLFVLGLVALLGFNVNAQYDFCDTSSSNHPLYYKIYGNAVRLVAPGNGYPYYGYTRPSGDVVVPDTVSFGGNDYPVVAFAENAFISCSQITSITIPHTVEDIMANAFNGCLGLQQLTALPPTPPAVQSASAFTSVPVDIPVWVPAVAFPLYRTDQQWNRFTDIRSIVDSTQGNYFLVSLESSDTSKGTVCGSGVYVYGTTVDLYALSKYNMRFMGWSDGNTDNPRRVALVSDTMLTAMFSDADTVYIVDSVWVYDTVYVDVASVAPAASPWVWVDGNELVVMNRAGLPVTLFDIDGRQLRFVKQSDILDNAPVRITAPRNGLFLLRVGSSATVKVRVPN